VAAAGPRVARQIGEPAPGLAHDHVECREVPDGDLRLAGDVDGALGHEHVAPEVAVGAGAPDRPGQVEEAVEPAPLLPAGQARVRQARVGEVGDVGDPAAGRVLQPPSRPGADVLGRPPPAVQGGCGHQPDDRLVAVEQRDQSGPHGHAADEVLRPVDRVEDPAAGAVPRRPELLAHDGVAGTGPAEGDPEHLLDGAVGVGHGGQVRLGVDLQVLCPEPLQADGVGLVGQHVRQSHVLGKAAAGCHGHRTYCGNAPGPLNRCRSGADTVGEWTPRRSWGCWPTPPG
jgi:hypothetical protein